jgi:hypothetical protein
LENVYFGGGNRNCMLGRNRDRDWLFNLASLKHFIMKKLILLSALLWMACKNKPKVNTGPFKAGDTVTVSIERDSMGTTAILTTPRIVMTDRNHGPAELIDGSDTVKTFSKYSGSLYISGKGTTGRPIGLGKRKIDTIYRTGDTTKDIISRLKEIVPLRPKQVSLPIGDQSISSSPLHPTQAGADTIIRTIFHDTVYPPRLVGISAESFMVYNRNNLIAELDTFGIWHVKDTIAALGALLNLLKQSDSLRSALYRENDSLKNLLHR